MDAVGATLVDRYRLQAQLGHGQMGQVYAARDLQTGEDVAIKILPAGLAEDPSRRQRFEREHRVGRTLKHPNLPWVGDVGTTPQGGRFLVMELLRGTSLDHSPPRGKALDSGTAIRVIAQVADALSAAHAKRVVHRDLAPKNIIIEGSWEHPRAVLIDWGAVRFIDDTDEQDPDDPFGDDVHTAVGVRLGTPSYMSPEYITSGDIDHRGDLYALGATLYRLLSGHPPFVGGVHRVMDDHVETPAPRVRDSVPSCPPWLDALVDDLLAKDPAERPASAEDVLARLEAGVGQPLRYVPHPQTAPRAGVSRRWMLPVGLLLLSGLTGAALLASAAAFLLW